MARAMRELRLLNKLEANEPVLATFNFLKGARTSQVLANTGLDVRCPHRASSKTVR